MKRKQKRFTEEPDIIAAIDSTNDTIKQTCDEANRLDEKADDEFKRLGALDYDNLSAPHRFQYGSAMQHAKNWRAEAEKLRKRQPALRKRLLKYKDCLAAFRTAVIKAVTSDESVVL